MELNENIPKYPSSSKVNLGTISVGYKNNYAVDVESYRELYGDKWQDKVMEELETEVFTGKVQRLNNTAG
jgi:hypothetical protein